MQHRGRVSVGNAHDPVSRSGARRRRGRAASPRAPRCRGGRGKGVTTELASRVVETGAIGVEVAGATDRGTVRTENQDAWGATPRIKGVALALADGMGGHAGGRESAEAAIEAAMHRLAADWPPDRALEAAVHDASAAVNGVRDLIGGDPGTTLVLACIENDHAFIANVGDSRAYLIRDGASQQLTNDHSWVGDELRAGRLDGNAARHHPRRNLI